VTVTSRSVRWLLIIPTLFCALPTLFLSLKKERDGSILFLPFLGVQPDAITLTPPALLLVWGTLVLFAFSTLAILAWRRTSWSLAWFYCTLVVVSSLLCVWRSWWVLAHTELR